MKKFLAVLLIITGTGIFLFESIFGGLILLLIGLNLISTEGSEINLSNNTYRSVKSLFGLKFGQWKPCPKFEYVSVFKTKETTRINAHAAEIASIKNEVIMLNLFYKGNKHITFYKTDNKTDAFNVANHFKLALDVAILDATENQTKWLD